MRVVLLIAFPVHIIVARPGKVLDPLGETPDVVGADLGEVADALLRGA